MNSNLQSKIINLNKDFYNKTAKEFSASRQYPWKGWFGLVPILNSLPAQVGNIYDPVSVLDLGCGNGRFLSFLNEHMTSHTFEYIGIDTCDFLSKTASTNVKSQKSKVKYVNADIFNLKDLPSGKFNVVTAFGITHHIPGQEFRKDWFKAISNLVSDSGLLVLSFWNPDKSKLLNEKMEGFEEGDYLMGWDKSSAKRYVHIYSDLEIDEIISNYAKLGLRLTNRYKSDEKKQSFNEYLIFSRIKNEN